jgi:Tol biopolymer transport system component
VPASSEQPRQNGEILFSNGRFYLMRPDGTHQRPIARGPYGDGSWSPDGKRIALAGGPAGVCSVRLFVMRADGARVRPLTEGGQDPAMPGTCYGRPTWSPDGIRIAFTATGDVGYASIWEMNIDGTGRRQLTYRNGYHEGDDRDPAWSPDATTIAFDRGYPPTLWLMDGDGTNQHPLKAASGSCRGAEEPDWSPDGQRIAFVRNCKPGAGGGEEDWSDIWLIRPDGSDLRRLTHAGPRAWANRSPAWSPDGKRIVFERLVRRSRYAHFEDIYVMNADGTGQKRLTPGGSPDWGPRQ